jgi:hypothetical protein
MMDGTCDNDAGRRAYAMFMHQSGQW